MKALNELRRRAVEELSESLSVKEPVKNVEVTYTKPSFNAEFNKMPIVLVHTKEQFDVAADFEDIYVGVTAELIKKEKPAGKNLILVLPDVIRIKDYEYVNLILKQACNNGFAAVLVRNFEALRFVKSDLPVIIGSEIYVANKSALNFAKGACAAHIAPLELSSHELAECYDDDTYIFAYGKLPLMHTANCVVKTTEGCRKHKGDAFTYIKDRTDTVFPVYRNCDTCSNIIYNSVPTFLLEEIKSSKFSAERTVLSFTDEDADTTRNILSLYLKHEGKSPEKFTKAYWKRGVE